MKRNFYSFLFLNFIRKLGNKRKYPQYYEYIPRVLKKLFEESVKKLHCAKNIVDSIKDIEEYKTTALTTVRAKLI